MSRELFCEGGCVELFREGFVVIDPAVISGLFVSGPGLGLELTAPGKLDGGPGLERGEVVASTAEAVALGADVAVAGSVLGLHHHLLVGHGGVVRRELGYGTVEKMGSFA